MDNQELTEKLEEIEQHPLALQFEPNEVLLEGLFNSEDKIRQKAINLTGAFDAADFIEPLFKLAAADDDIEFRLAALNSLGNYLHRGVMADYHLRETPVSKPETMAETTGITYQHFCVIREFMASIVEQKDWPAKLRAAALLYSAMAEPQAAAIEIEQFYNSGEPELVLGALKAISRIKSGNWTTIIMQELTREINDPRRRAAIEAAGVHDVYEAGPALVRIIEEENEANIKKRAVEALGYISWPHAPEELKRFSESNQAEIANIAQTALIRRSGT